MDKLALLERLTTAPPKLSPSIRYAYAEATTGAALEAALAWGERTTTARAAAWEWIKAKGGNGYFAPPHLMGPRHHRAPRRHRQLRREAGGARLETRLLPRREGRRPHALGHEGRQGAQGRTRHPAPVAGRPRARRPRRAGRSDRLCRQVGRR